MVETEHFPSWPVTKTVIFIEPNALHCTGLSVGGDHDLADKLSLGLLELGGLKKRVDT
jgi:hypothetical protein